MNDLCEKFENDLVDLIKNFDYDDDGLDEEAIRAYVKSCIRDYMLDSALGVAQKVWNKKGCAIVKKNKIDYDKLNTMLEESLSNETGES